MKRIFLVLLLVLFVPFVVACDERPQIKILMPGEYITPETIEAFTEEHGIRVRVDEFASNEEALTFIKSGEEYDLVLPSEYAMEQLMVENPNYIQKVDWNRITTFNKDTDLAHGLDTLINDLKMTKGLDLLEYGVPYFWGSVGLLYNKNVVSAADAAQGWELLRMGDKYNVAFYDSSRDALMAPLMTLGYSMNSSNATEINEAKAWIEVAAKKKNVGYLTDNIFDEVPNGNYDIAMAYSGDAAEIMNIVYEEEVNLDLDFLIPDAGTNIFVDFLVIHSSADLDNTYKFLNHIISYDGALKNTINLFYISPREDVRQQQINSANTERIKELFTINFRPQDDIFRFNPESKALIDDAWNSLGVSRQGGEISTIGIIAIFGAIVVVGAVSAVLIIRRKRR
ncbi:MAG: extracellular solute-binding protein [Acholeplasmataceae bacterium]|jgi:spermidine/putrescine-binding protein